MKIHVEQGISSQHVPPGTKRRASSNNHFKAMVIQMKNDMQFVSNDAIVSISSLYIIDVFFFKGWANWKRHINPMFLKRFIRQ